MAQDLGSILQGTAQLGETLFGTDTTTKQKGTTKGTTTRTEKLNISDEAIQKIIQDVLGGAGGLANIFAGEQSAGIFDSSVAAQAAGDLASKLVGEIATLTAEREATEKVKSTTKAKGGSDKEGILGKPLKKLGGVLGF